MHLKIWQIFLLSLIILIKMNSINSTLQVKLDDKEQKCFIEELFPDSILSIKWKVELGSNLFIEKRNKTKEELSNIVSEDIIRGIIITIIDNASREIIKTINPQFNKDKESFKPSGQGKFAICVQYRGKSVPNDEIFFSMKLNSNNMDEPNLRDAIKTHHLNDINNQTSAIISFGNNIISKQNVELGDEDHFATMQLSMVENYNLMVCIQLIVMILLSFYQIWSFKKFLIANNII
jgi:hypothetical protein